MRSSVGARLGLVPASYAECASTSVASRSITACPMARSATRDVRAGHCADVVRGHQSADPGAARLGEVALVDCTSPVGRTGTTYLHTLLDENVTCRIAWGRPGIKQAIPDFAERSAAEIDALGVNHSAVHVDFMIGGPEVTLTGILPDGARRDILRDNVWCLD